MGSSICQLALPRARMASHLATRVKSRWRYSSGYGNIEIDESVRWSIGNIFSSSVCYPCAPENDVNHHCNGFSSPKKSVKDILPSRLKSVMHHVISKGPSYYKRSLHTLCFLENPTPV